ncbi:MAG: flagellar basal body rod protein FlgC [Phycisphaerae bacterium]|nr:flagellar basal body rod protein FlgC [Phycisphaerae bacterium]
MYGTLDISVSGMVAQRIRMDTIATNLANRDTILDAAGNTNPFQRRIAVFQPGQPDGSPGVHVSDITIENSEPRKVYEPDNPYAQTEGPDAGYVYYPNIDPVTENVSAIEAVRSYEANVAAAEATKTMIAQALRLLA